MSRLHLPARVERELQKEKWVDQRREHRSQLFAMLNFDDPVCRRWTPELRKLDEHMSMARGRERAGGLVKPGYYYFVRDAETATTLIPVTAADGESWAEPDSRTLEALKASDLQDPRVFAKVLAAQVLEEQQAERDKLREREARQGELMERVAAATRAQVSMSDHVPWAQNAAGYNRIRKNKRTRKGQSR